MKKSYCKFLLISLIIILTACTQKNIDIAKEISKMESTYDVIGNNAPQDGILLLVNNPNTEMLSKVTVSEKKDLSDTFEQILIVPKKENTVIEIWSLREMNDEIVRNEQIYYNRRTGKDFVLSLNINRPEGIPQYKMIVRTPDAFAEYIFAYNGKEGTPDREYVIGTKIDSNSEFSYNEMGYIFTYTEDEILNLYGEPSKKMSIDFLGNETATELYYNNTSFKVDDESKNVYYAIVADNNIIHPRGIQVGDDMNRVVHSFPSNGDNKKILFESNDIKKGEYSILYGEYYHMKNFGMIEYVEGAPVRIMYSQEASCLSFEIENRKVSRIKYEIPLV